MVFHIIKSRSDIQQNSGGGGWGRGAYSRHIPPAPKPPSCKICIAKKAYMRTNTQIKFLYYPLFTSIKTVVCMLTCAYAITHIKYRRLQKANHLQASERFC